MFLGVILIIFGIFFIFFPRLIKKINELGKKILFNDEGALKHNVTTGIIFIIIGIIIFLINFFLR